MTETTTDRADPPAETATVVYRYGVTAPREGAEVVYDQMRRAREYRRTLVFVEQERRRAARQAIVDFSPEVGSAEAAVVGADAACQWLAAEIRMARKAARKRAETGAMRAGLARARAVTRERRLVLFALRDRFSAQCPACRKAKSEAVPCAHATSEARRLRARLDEVDECAAALQRGARALSGLYWGTYLLVERAMQASRAAPLYERDGVTPHDPRAPRSLSDSVAVQIQKTRPLTVRGAEAGTDSRLRIEAPPWPEAWLAANPVDTTSPSRMSSRRPGQRLMGGEAARAVRADGTPARWVRDRAAREGLLRMRVGVSADEWAAWRLDMHRPLPPESAITWATVVRRWRGPHAEWSLCLTVEVPHPPAPPPTGKTVAVDVGWRVIEGSLRVAAWADSDGRSGELRLSATDLRALTTASEVRSLRDHRLDALKLRLGEWLRVASPEDCPAWLRAEAASLRLWRNPARFVRLLGRWEKAGGPASPVSRVAYEDLRAWAQDDRHRWAEQEHRRAWGLRRRRERYRVFAAALAKAYDTVVLERFDLRRVAERRPVGQDGAENEAARANRQLAAVSELRGAVQNACRARGRAVVAVDATDSTRTCPSCGLVADRDQDARVVLRCECGHEWDQDREGAAPILLTRYQTQPGDAKVLVAGRADAGAAEAPKKRGSKWERARRMGAQKKARGEAARTGS